MKYLTVNKSYQ